jgi:Domain of unknown function (DUF6316)
MSNVLRKRESDGEYNNYKRDDRFFNLDDNWYFTTREGLVMGPYESRCQAESESATYIRFLKFAHPPVVNLVTRNKMAFPEKADND